MNNIQQTVEQDFGTEQLGVPQVHLGGEAFRVNFSTRDIDFKGVEVLINSAENYERWNIRSAVIVLLNQDHQNLLITGNEEKKIPASEYQQYLIGVVNNVRGTAVKLFNSNDPIREEFLVGLDLFEGKVVSEEIKRALRFMSYVHEDSNQNNFNIYTSDGTVHLDIELSDGYKFNGYYNPEKGTAYTSEYSETEQRNVEIADNVLHFRLNQSSIKVVRGNISRSWYREGNNSASNVVEA